MDHPLRLERLEPGQYPWRVAAVALGAVAAIELVLLVVAGGALVAKPEERAATKARPVAAKQATTTSVATKKQRAQAQTAAAATSLPRGKVGVIVLNGNGRQGAAATVAARASRRGYRIRAVANAPSTDYPSSIVMYRPGFLAEGRRLARDLGIQVVGPLDGMRPKQLHGAHTVLILGR